MAASSRADLTSAIQCSFLIDVPDARSVNFSAVRRRQWCGRRSLGDKLRRDWSCSSMASCLETVIISDGVKCTAPFL